MAEKGKGKTAGAAPENQAGARKKKLVFIAVGIAAAILAVFTIWYLLRDDSAEDIDPRAAAGLPAKALYIELDPAFVVTFGDTRSRQRFLQVSLAVLARDARAADLVKLHQPLLRHRLNLLLSEQDIEVLRTDDGKQALRQACARVVNEFLATHAPGMAIEQVLFTNFVMQ